MDERQLNLLMENDREWRKYMIEKLDSLSTEVSEMKAWNLTFRVLGSAVFSIALAVVALFGK